MLAEWAECAECAEWVTGRCAACFLGDPDGERALDLVCDRDLRFFFFSWGLLERVRFLLAPGLLLIR